VPSTPSAPPERVVAPQSPAELAQFYAAIGQTPGNPMVFSVGSGSLRKTGMWVVSPFLLIEGGLGSLLLDFQRASAQSSVIGIEVNGGMGEMVLVLPNGWGADISSVRAGYGFRQSSVADHPVEGFPFLYIRGRMTFGSLRIRYPRRSDERRLARELRHEQRHQPAALR
jgi:hypothetical protein